MAYIEQPGSRRFELGLKGASGTMIWHAASDQELLDIRTDWPLGALFPIDPDILGTKLRLLRYEVEPFGAGDSRYRVTAEFITDTANQNFFQISHSMDIGQESVNARNRNWGSGGAVDQDNPIFYGTTDIVEQRIFRYWPLPMIRAFRNTVNATRLFDSPRGHVLFYGAQISQDYWGLSPEQTNLGAIKGFYQTELRFVDRDIDHNMIWNETSSQFDYTVPLKYPYADLSRLLAV